VGSELSIGGSPVWFAPSSLWGLVQRSKRDRDPTTGNGFLPKYFGVEGMQFSTFPQSLSTLYYSNANLLDLDLARIARPFCFCMYFNGSSTCKLLWCNKDTIDLICLLHVCLS
jgi:hypothetical protein